MQLIKRHLILQQRPLELGVVIHIRHLRYRVLLRRQCRVQSLGDGLRGLLELLEERGGDGEEVDARKAADLGDVPEGGAHDDGVVTVLFVVVEDALDGLHAWVFVAGVVAVVLLFVPVEDLNTA